MVIFSKTTFLNFYLSSGHFQSGKKNISLKIFKKMCNSENHNEGETVEPFFFLVKRIILVSLDQLKSFSCTMLFS